MSLCILTGGKLLTLAVSAFTLSWTHSIEKTEWRESWQITPQGLQLSEAASKGSGAGMEPGPGAKLRNGWWVWTPDMHPLRRISLAASGATDGGWTLCSDQGCLALGEIAGDAVTVSDCSEPSSTP
jgi:hypothetical protein